MKLFIAIVLLVILLKIAKKQKKENDEYMRNRYCNLVNLKETYELANKN